MSAFKIIKQELKPEFYSGNTPNLVGNVGDRIVATIEATFEAVFYASSTFQLEYGSGNVNDPLQLRYLTVGRVAFENFRVGDTIEIIDPDTTNAGTYTIQEKISDQRLVVDTNLSIAVPASSNAAVVNTTPMKGLKFAYGLTSNQDALSFNSRIDGSVQEFKFDNYGTLSTAVETMLPSGNKSWQNNTSCTVQRLATGIGQGNQVFRFIHTFEIDPIYLAGQLNNFGTGEAPDYLRINRSLRYDFRVYGAEDISNDSAFRFSTQEKLIGNTGWFNESLNNNVSDYNLSSTLFERLPSLEVINGVELVTTEQQVTLVLESTPQAPFIDLNSQFRLTHTYLPAQEGEYQLNNKTVVENFYQDRVFQTVGVAAIAGEQFGTDQQVFTEVSAVRDSATQITITAKIQLTQAMVDDISARDQKRFLLSVATADVARTASTSNAANAYFQNVYAVDTFDAGLFGLNTVILDHTETDVETEGRTNPTGRIEDDLLAYSRFNLDRLGRETDEIDIKNATIEIIAEKNDGTFFVLESFTKSFSGLPIIDGEKYIDFVQPRPFKMPDGDQRKLIQIRRNAALDTGLNKAYEFYYPFRMRNETWQPLSTVSDDFFDTSEPNDGKNELWNRFAADANYTINYWIRISSTENGNPQEHSLKNEIFSFGYAESADWDNETIQAFDSSNNELINGGDKYLTLFDNMTIRSDFEWVGTGSPTTGDIVIEFRVDLFEQGSIFDTRYFSSKYNWEQNSYFTSNDLSGKIIVSNPSGTIFRGECTLKTNELPQAQEYKISARYYNLLAEIPAGAKMMEDGTIKIMEDGTIKIIE